MKKVITIILLCSAFVFANGQPTAYKGGNYNGVLGVFSNPANIASNPRKWDVNLLSVSAMIANNKTEVGLSKIKNGFKDDFFEGEQKEFSGLINVDIIGPSFMMNLNPKHSIAITTRARAFGNIGTLNTKLAQAIKDAENVSSLPYELNTGNQQIALNAWTEVGVSWGGVIFDKKNHLIKVGATLKMLRGAGNSFINMKDLQATIDVEQSQDPKPYLTNGSGQFILANSGVDLLDDDFDKNDLLGKNGNGIGFDLGIVYEYRDSIGSWCENCQNKGYKFKIGASLVDFGAIKYNSIAENSYSYKLNIPAGQRLYLESFSGSLEEIEKTLDDSPYATKEKLDETYKPSLPTTLNLMADYHWGRNIFTEFSAHLSLVDTDKPENAYYYNSFTLTPRYENTYFGLYFPLNYNDISEFNAGVTVRMGPLIVGSGSVISTLLSESHQADVFVGLRFGL